MQTKFKRNATIEFMRFVFCMLVILYHINNRLDFELSGHLSFFANGKIGVEFFFLVSGWLMAKSALKYNEKPIVNSTKKFMYGKVMGVLPLHLLAFFTCYLMLAVRPTSRMLDKFTMLVNALPNLFFLQKSGILASKAIITPEWYIAAMLWMMLIIFPLILRFRDKFTKIACPIIAVLLLGYLMHDKGQLGGVNRFVFNNTVSKVYVRAFAEMCGGAFCFELSNALIRFEFKKADKVFLTLVEGFCYLAPVLYSFTDLSTEYELYVYYMLAVAVTLSFSSVTYSAIIFNNALSIFLGKASLPLYMAQTVGFTVFLCFPNIFDGVRKKYIALFFILSTFIFAIVFNTFAKPLYRGINNKLMTLTNHPERIVKNNKK